MNIATSHGVAASPEPSPPAAESSRLTWLDTFRGLSIALVVLGHVLGGLAFAAFVPDPSKDRLWEAYDLLYNASNRYVLMIEYYNPSPMMIMHRGMPDQMFKRDFAREMLEAHPDLNLLEYGFVYHRDLVFPFDDVTWFLFEKPAGRK